MIITVSHQKGGVGKSTVAWNLAVTLQKRDYTIELIDLDTQQTLYYTNLIRKDTPKLKPLTLKRFEGVEQFKAYARTDTRKRISIVDVGGFDSDLGRVAIAFADLVITPVNDRNFELLGLKRYETILAAISHVLEETVTVHILLNNLDPRKTRLDDLKRFLEDSPHFTLMRTILRRRSDYDKSTGVGKSVVEYDKTSKAAKEIKALVKEVEDILKI